MTLRQVRGRQRVISTFAGLLSAQADDQVRHVGRVRPNCGLWFSKGGPGRRNWSWPLLLEVGRTGLKPEAMSIGMKIELSEVAPQLSVQIGGPTDLRNELVPISADKKKALSKLCGVAPVLDAAVSRLGGGSGFGWSVLFRSCAAANKHEHSSKYAMAHELGSNARPPATARASAERCHASPRSLMDEDARSALAKQAVHGSSVGVIRAPQLPTDLAVVYVRLGGTIGSPRVSRPASRS